MTSVIENDCQLDQFSFHIMKTIFAPSEPLQTAVLLIIFNRPETTKLVFEAIRKAKPPRLYIAADGPRPEVATDAELCKATRQIVENIDWDCQVNRGYQTKNLNCGRGPSSAISWFFRHEDQGIILEDDCFPSQSFFWYCEELLNRYKDDARVMHIGGNNFQNGWQHDTDYSYYFSQNGHIWGWATWRRAWKKFDFEIKNFQRLDEDGFFDYFFLNPIEKFYRLRKLKRTWANHGNVNWWDYQWDFARYTNHALAIVPQVNLVKNIGFGKGATHTLVGTSNYTEAAAVDIDLPLTHPPYMLKDIESDRRYFKNFMSGIIRNKAHMPKQLADLMMK